MTNFLSYNLMQQWREIHRQLCRMVSPRKLKQDTSSESTQSNQYQALEDDSTTSSRVALIDRGASNDIPELRDDVKSVLSQQDF